MATFNNFDDGESEAVDTSLSPISDIGTGRGYFGRRGSAPAAQELQEHSASFEDPSLPPRARSQSNATIPDRRDEWSKKILEGKRLQKAIADLTESKSSYEREASKHGWHQIDQNQAEVVGKLQDVAARKEFTGNDLEGPKFLRKCLGKCLPKCLPECLDKFSCDKISTIGLRYTQLLDVVMNQAPLYALIAWGSLKILLIAHINHTRLKEMVEDALLQIADQLGLVHELMGHIPSEAMATAVGDLYACFSMFLSKALTYYCRSRLRKYLNAFGFPWERHFEWLVGKMQQQFTRIQEITSVGHLGATLEILRLTKDTHEGRGEPKHLGASIKQDVNETMSGHFMQFEQKWVAKFENLLAIALKRESVVTEHEEFNSSSSESNIFLADYMSMKEKLPEFMSMVFPDLQDFRNNESRIRSLNKYLLDPDFGQCLKFLEHEKTQAWLVSETSSIVWVNSHKTSPLADWATAITTRLIDHAARLKNTTVLQYFSMQHNRKNAMSTAASFVQVLTVQVLEQFSHRFLVRSTQFTLQRVKEMAANFSGLWAIFREVLSAAVVGNPTCIWIFIDRIDMLKLDNSNKASGDLLTLLGHLDDLTKDDTIVVKIFITARHTSVSQQLESEIKCGKLPSFRDTVITMPHGTHQFTAALCAKNRKRLGELNVVASPKKTKAPKAMEHSIEISNPALDDFCSSDSSVGVANGTGNTAPKAVQLDVPRFIRTNVDSSEQDSMISLDDDFQSSSEPDWSTRGISKSPGASIRHSPSVTDESRETGEDPFAASSGSESHYSEEDVAPAEGDDLVLTTPTPQTSAWSKPPKHEEAKAPADGCAVDDTLSDWDSGPDV